MANLADTFSDLNYADRLWQAADKFWRTMDAAECKNVVLGLLSVKYIADSFELRHPQFSGSRKEATSPARIRKDPKGCDEYAVERVVWMPREVRRQNLQNQSHKPARDMLSRVYEPVVMTPPINQAVGWRILP